MGGLWWGEDMSFGWVFHPYAHSSFPSAEKDFLSVYIYSVLVTTCTCTWGELEP